MAVITELAPFIKFATDVTSSDAALCKNSWERAYCPQFI